VARLHARAVDVALIIEVTQLTSASLVRQFAAVSAA
jgi:hypothetical protein